MPFFPSGGGKNRVAVLVALAFGLCLLLALANTTKAPEAVVAVAPVVLRQAPEAAAPPGVASGAAPAGFANRPHAANTPEPGTITVEGYWWDVRWLGFLLAGGVGFLVVAPALVRAWRAPEDDFDPQYRFWAYVALAFVWGGLALVAFAEDRGAYVGGFFLAGSASVLGLCMALCGMAKELKQAAEQPKWEEYRARPSRKVAWLLWGTALLLQLVLPWLLIAELARLEWPGPNAERARSDFWEQVPIPIGFSVVLMPLLLPLFLARKSRPSIMPRSVLMCVLTASLHVVYTVLLVASLPNTFAPVGDHGNRVRIEYRNRYSGRVTGSTGGAAFRGDAFLLVLLPTAVGAVVWLGVFGGIQWKRLGDRWMPITPEPTEAPPPSLPAEAGTAGAYIVFTCPCSHRLKAKATLAGMRIKCPQCGLGQPVPERSKT